jgi:hypothetical protein
VPGVQSRAAKNKVAHRTADAAAHAAAGAADIIYQIYELLMPQTNTGASFSSALFRGVSAHTARQSSLFQKEESYDLPPLSNESLLQKQYFPALFLH